MISTVRKGSYKINTGKHIHTLLCTYAHIENAKMLLSKSLLKGKNTHLCSSFLYLLLPPLYFFDTDELILQT